MLMAWNVVVVFLVVHYYFVGEWYSLRLRWQHCNSPTYCFLFLFVCLCFVVELLGWPQQLGETTTTAAY